MRIAAGDAPVIVTCIAAGDAPVIGTRIAAGDAPVIVTRRAAKPVRKGKVFPVFSIN
jgi:hypothetical protein